jgi:hypothetical protein
VPPVALKVKIPGADYAALQAIQAEIGRLDGGLIPEPSIHALAVRAIRNYIATFNKED